MKSVGWLDQGWSDSLRSIERIHACIDVKAEFRRILHCLENTTGDFKIF
jgi:hypothetical protein